jgi:hypothetical protein
MRAIKVNVTKDHIRKGIRGSACDCPLALALKETLITTNVSVDANSIRVNHVYFKTDKKDVRFIERFDAGKPVRPYSLELCR